jgi:hypothetical protein
MDTVQVNSDSKMSRECNSVEPYCKGMWTENEYGKTLTMRISSNLDTHRMRVNTFIKEMDKLILFGKLKYFGKKSLWRGQYKNTKQLSVLLIIKGIICNKENKKQSLKIYKYIFKSVSTCNAEKWSLERETKSKSK